MYQRVNQRLDETEEMVRRMYKNFVEKRSDDTAETAEALAVPEAKKDEATAESGKL